jgi:regulator of RNase E activity RraA
MINRIIDYIRQNRVSTTEIADCMGKVGVLDNSIILNKKYFKVGKIHYCYCDNESNWNVHRYIQNIEENSIVLVDDLGSNNRGIFGDLVSKYIILYKQASAIVTNGNIRDTHTLVKENYPIWCKGSNPVGCFNTEPQHPIDEQTLKKRKEYFTDSIAVCDDAGVVIITKEYMTETFFRKLEWIEEQEDIWFDCIDRKKWNTFETICLKKYKEPSDE